MKSSRCQAQAQVLILILIFALPPIFFLTLSLS